MSVMKKSNPRELMFITPSDFVEAEERLVSVLSQNNATIQPGQQDVRILLPREDFLMPHNSFLKFDASITLGTGDSSTNWNKSVASVIREVRIVVGDEVVSRCEEFGLIDDVLTTCTSDITQEKVSSWYNGRGQAASVSQASRTYCLKFKTGLLSVLQSIPLSVLPQVRIEIDFNAISSALCCTSGTLGTATYSVSNLSYSMHVVKPNPEYLNAFQREMASGKKLSYLIPNYMLVSPQQYSSTSSLEKDVRNERQSVKGMLVFMRKSTDISTTAPYPYRYVNEINVDGGTGWQITIGNDNLPNTPIKLVQSYMELLRFFNQTGSEIRTLINYTDYTSTSAIALSGSSTSAQPDAYNKCVLALNTEKFIEQSGRSGTDFRNKPATIRINGGSSASFTLYPVVFYDTLMVFDPLARVLYKTE